MRIKLSAKRGNCKISNVKVFFTPIWNDLHQYCTNKKKSVNIGGD